MENRILEFEHYKTLVNKYCKIDCREINFQNRIILPMLESICEDNDNNEIDIVDVSTQYKHKESEIHTRQYYANEYTPDLLIAKKWNYNNLLKTEDDYIAVVEIKSPKIDPLSKRNNHTEDEVKSYLLNINKVILTDCFKWVFYERFSPEPKSFILYQDGNWVDCASYTWGKLISYIGEIIKC